VIDLLTSFDPVLSAKAQQVKKIGRKMLRNRKFAVSDSFLNPPGTLHNGLQLLGCLQGLILRKSLQFNR
jgi:hypothetical protein